MKYSPLETSFAFLPYVVTAVVFSTQGATRLVRRIRPGIMIATGMSLFSVALFTLVRLTPESSYLTEVLPALILFGTGVGTLMVPAVTTAMSGAGAKYSGVVSALVNTSQQAGASIGAALLNTIAVSAAAAYLASGPTGASTELDAKVHGFVIASLCAAEVVFAGALFAVIAINADVPASGSDPGRAGARLLPRRRRRGKHRRTRRPAGRHRNWALQTTASV